MSVRWIDLAWSTSVWQGYLSVTATVSDQATSSRIGGKSVPVHVCLAQLQLCRQPCGAEASAPQLPWLVVNVPIFCNPPPTARADERRELRRCATMLGALHDSPCQPLFRAIARGMLPMACHRPHGNPPRWHCFLRAHVFI